MKCDVEKKLATLISSFKENHQFHTKKWLKRCVLANCPENDSGDFTPLYKKKRELAIAEEVFYRKFCELDVLYLNVCIPKLAEFLDSEKKLNFSSIEEREELKNINDCKLREYDACEAAMEQRRKDIESLEEDILQKRKDILEIERLLYKSYKDQYSII